MSRLAGSRAGSWAAIVSSAFAAGTGLAYGASVGPIPGLGMLAVVVVVAGAILVGARRARSGLIVAMLGLALLGLWRGASAVIAPGPGRIDGHLGSGSMAVTGTVRSATPGGGADVIVDVHHLVGADAETNLIGGLLVSAVNLPAVAPGDQVEVDVTALRAPNRRPGPQSESTLEREGVEAVAVAPLMTVVEHGGPSVPRAVAAVQARLVAAVELVLPQPEAALLLGVAFGIHRPLPADVRGPLQDAGLIHIVVVSGLKVVMLLGLIVAIGNAAQWPLRRTAVVGLLVVSAYVLLSGAGPAAIRSALMAGVALLGRFRGRRVDPVPMLALVAAVMLAVDPPVVLDPGFQLSFLGTVGILLLAAPLSARIPGPRLLAEPFAVTVAAQVATIPVMAGTFGVLSLVAPLANALVLPILPALIVIGGGGALLAVVAPALGWLPLHLAGVGVSAAIAVGRLLTALPGSSIPIGNWPSAWTIAEVAGIGVAVVVLTWRRAHHGLRTRAVAAAVAAGLVAAVTVGFVASQPDGTLHVTVLDTGSAPAVLVETGDGSLALVDGGASPAQLQQALGRALPLLAHRLGMVVLTGGNQTAVAGLAGLAGHYEVGVVLAARGLPPGANAVVEALRSGGADVLDPAGAAWTWGGASWRCLPITAAAGASACAVTVADASGRLLVLGDAGTADQEELCALYGARLAADVVVTPPGGALSGILVEIAKPRSIAVPVARGGHVVAAPRGVSVDQTGADGDLAFVGGPGGLTEIR